MRVLRYYLELLEAVEDLLGFASGGLFEVKALRFLAYVLGDLALVF